MSNDDRATSAADSGGHSPAASADATRDKTHSVGLPPIAGAVSHWRYCASRGRRSRQGLISDCCWCSQAVEDTTAMAAEVPAVARA